MTTFKPATPLPLRFLPDDWNYIVDANGNIVAEIPCQVVEKDMELGDYIVRACNEYPKLIEDRARLVEALRSIANRVPPNVAGDGATETARAVLRELGEL